METEAFHFIQCAPFIFGTVSSPQRVENDFLLTGSQFFENEIQNGGCLRLVLKLPSRKSCERLQGEVKMENNSLDNAGTPKKSDLTKVQSPGSNNSVGL